MRLEVKLKMLKTFSTPFSPTLKLSCVNEITHYNQNGKSPSIFLKFFLFQNHRENIIIKNDNTTAIRSVVEYFTDLFDKFVFAYLLDYSDYLELELF